MNKFRKVKVDTPSGRKTLILKEIPNTEELKNICEIACPYNGICEHLRDPRSPEDPDKNFMDLCSSLGEKIEETDTEDESLGNCVPVEGTLERDLFDPNETFDGLYKDNPAVRIKDIIDNVCPEWCDKYKPDHSGCSFGAGCFLKSVMSRSPKKDGGEETD